MELKAKTRAGQVSELIGLGWSRGQIAKELNISERKVSLIRRKLNSPGLDSRRIAEIHEMCLAIWKLLDELYGIRLKKTRGRLARQEERELAQLMAEHADRFAEIQKIETGPDDDEEEITLPSSPGNGS